MDWLGQAGLTDTVSWGLVLGVFLPWATALVQQPGWSADTRKIVAVASAIAAGVLTCLANGSLDQGQTVLATVAIILTASQTAYRGLWKARPDTPEGVANDSLALASKIERATSARRAHGAHGGAQAPESRP